MDSFEDIFAEVDMIASFCLEFVMMLMCLLFFWLMFLPSRNFEIRAFFVIQGSFR